MVTEPAVLVVDDDSDIRESLETLLSALGFKVTSVSGGIEALALLRSGRYRPDVIVLDLMMPNMNGAEFLAQLRREPGVVEPSIVFFTGAGPLAADQIAALKPKFLLRKPVDLDILISHIQGALGSRHLC
jgi:CheY-like chemotaxis protein